MKRGILVAVIFALVGIGVAAYLNTRERGPFDRDREPSAIAGTHTPTPLPQAGPSPQTGSSPLSTPTLVGRQVCGECHTENFHLHAKHGHASTFAKVQDSEVVKAFAGKSFDAGESHGTYTYHCDDQGRLFATLPGKFGNQPFPLQYALGSGHTGVTFLSMIPTDGGGTAGIEHRVSWYSDGRLDISPGHTIAPPVKEIEFFGNLLGEESLERCVYCHTTSAKFANQAIVDLVPNINCEKCHGPGSDHVQQARQSKTPPPYSVGRDDWDAESELQLCGDCHRMPRDVSEQELREYPELLARFQPIGLLRSQCYLESDGQLKCTTCHSPHTSIRATTDAEQVQNCVNCHLENSATHVACPVSPSEGCIECHMPLLKVERGLAFHDHWIRVRDDR